MRGQTTYPSLPAIEVRRQPCVAIIDDDTELTRAISRILRTRYNCMVRGYNSLEAFLSELDQETHRQFFEENLDLILLDFHLPGRDGPRLVKELEQRRSSLLEKSHIMGITGDGEAYVVNRFKDVGVDDIYQKPLSKIDFGNIADKAYKICSGLESVRRPRPSIITKYI